MAEISDAMILEWERLRALLVSTLQDKGIELADDATMQEAVEAVDEVSSEDTAVSTVNRSITNLRIDRLVNLNTSRYTSNYFFSYNNYIYGIFYDVVGVFLKNLATINDGWNLEGANFTHLYVPRLETVSYSNNGYMLAHNSKVVNFFAPSLATAHNLVVSGLCKRIIAPRAVTSRNYSFVNDDYDTTQKTNLELIDVKSVPSIRGQLNALQTLIIRKDTEIVPLNSASNIPSIENIYVPSALIDTYKSATNWSTIEDKIHTIEDSTYELENWYENESWYQDEMDYWRTIYPDFDA